MEIVLRVVHSLLADALFLSAALGYRNGKKILPTPAF
jgi:hypothetical protein